MSINNFIGNRFFGDESELNNFGTVNGSVFITKDTYRVFVRENGEWNEINVLTTSMGDLSDVSSSNWLDGYILKWNNFSDQWQAEEYTFITQTDTPSEYTNHENYFLKVNSNGDAVAFVDETEALNNSSIGGLSDVSDAGWDDSFMLRWDVGDQEWKAHDYTLISQTDTPANYTGSGGYFLKVDENENGIEFVDASNAISAASIGDLDDVDSTGWTIGYVLKWNGSEWTSSTLLNYWQEILNTSGVHNTRNRVRWSVVGGSTDTDAVIEPKGSGAFQLDSTGDKRGIYSVDLQRFNRSVGDEDEVALGNYSTISGGRHNTASADYATVSGGRDNIASGSNSTVAGGSESRATGNYSFAVGRQAHATHEGSFVLADSQNSTHSSSTNNEMRLRFLNGVYINNNLVETQNNKGVASGYTPLNSSTKVPLSYIDHIPFTHLNDTPTNYTGFSDNLVKVTTGEDGLEFVDMQTINVSEFNDDGTYISEVFSDDSLQGDGNQKELGVNLGFDFDWTGQHTFTTTPTVNGNAVYHDGNSNFLNAIATTQVLSSDFTLQAASYDSGNVFIMTGGTTQTITLGTASTGYQAVIIQEGSGNVEFVAGLGQTVNSKSGPSPSIFSQYAAATVIKRSSSEWLVIGDIQ